MPINNQIYGQGLVGSLAPPAKGPLVAQFGWPPFSVFNTREGQWQTHKRRWLNWMGIKSEEGREDGLTYKIPTYLSDGRPGRKMICQTSVFDPVLCELAYRWWCPPGGVVLDPFAGGSVRGIVAAVSGLRYCGVELQAGQVAANRAQWEAGPFGDCKYRPLWRCGDSFNEMPNAPAANFIFSCPPYGNLERYSDLPQDLSTMSYGMFIDRYGDIIGSACSRLVNNSYAAWVVANYRDKETGKLHDFVGDTIRAFEAAGLEYYNEAILINAVGTGAMRSAGTFIRGNRKLVKMHQNILVFVKGDVKHAAAKLSVPMGMEGADKTITEADDDIPF